MTKEQEKAVEQVPSDTEIEMTAFLHRAFNAVGCNPMCHCCQEMLTVGHRFKLGTVQRRSYKNLHFRHDLDKLHLKSLQGKKIKPSDVQAVVERDFYGEEYLEQAGGFEGVMKMVETTSYEVMLCDKCTAEEYMGKRIESLKEDIKERSKPKPPMGGCFRINGKVVH